MEFKVGQIVTLYKAKLSWTVLSIHRTGISVKCNEKGHGITHTVERSTPAYETFRLLSRFEAAVNSLGEFYAKP